MLSLKTKYLLIFVVFSGLLSGCGESVTVTGPDSSSNPKANIVLEPSQQSVNYDESVTLSWSAVDAFDCVASDEWGGSKSTSGTEVISQIQQDSVFTLSCVTDAGMVTQSVVIHVIPVDEPLLTFSTSSTVININNPVTLSWSSTNATDCVASGDWSGVKPSSGSEVIDSISTDRTFNLTCSGAGGDVTDSVSVSVVAPSVPTVSLTASSVNVAYDAATTLTWNSTNTASCTASGDWSGSKSTSGSQTITNLTSDKQYILTCSGAGGSSTESVTVTVQPAPAPTVNLSASLTSVAQGGSTTLSWNSFDASSCSASGDWSGSKSTSGSETIGSIDSDSQFNLTCSGPGGNTNDTVNIAVIVTPAPGVNLTSSTTTVSQGGSTTLSWNTTDASSCTASGDWSGSKATSGSETISTITVDSEFVLTCDGAGGSSGDSVSVAVVLNNNGTALLSWTPPTSNTDGSSLTDLAGYRIYYGTEPGVYSNSINVANAGLTSYLIENLAPASWYFVMTSYNSSNVESSYSVEVSKVIN